MGIEFHCHHCNKLVRAPREHGGKRGKCPYCKQSVYVPSAPEERQEISLAPLDQDAERRRKELEAESLRVQKALAGEQGDPGGGAEMAMPPPAAQGGADIESLVLRFVEAMRDSKLDEAERIWSGLRARPKQARNHVQRLLVDEIPPPGLEELPPALLKGFLRKLLTRL